MLRWCSSCVLSSATIIYEHFVRALLSMSCCEQNREYYVWYLLRALLSCCVYYIVLHNLCDFEESTKRNDLINCPKDEPSGKGVMVSVKHACNCLNVYYAFMEPFIGPQLLPQNSEECFLLACHSLYWILISRKRRINWEFGQFFRTWIPQVRKSHLEISTVRSIVEFRLM